MVCGEEKDSNGNFLSHRRIDGDSSHTQLWAGSWLTQLDRRQSHNEHLDSMHKDRGL